MFRKGFIALLLLLMTVSLMANGEQETEGASGDAYPTKAIKVIVPFSAGGGTDTHARILQRKIEKYLGQPVAVVNMGGAASLIGSREVLNAEPDGYTVLLNIPNLWTNKALGNANFGPLDFEPVAEAGLYYLCQVTGSNGRFTDLNELYDYAKKNPGVVSEATNIGAITYFTSLTVADSLGEQNLLKLVHIGDGAQRIANVLGNHIDTTIMGTQEAKPYVESGEMRVLGIYSEERVAGFEDAPTFIERGINVTAPIGYTFYMPKGTPENIVNIFADAVEKVMQDPEVVAKLESMSLIPSLKRGEKLVESLTKQGEHLMNIASKFNLSGK